MDNRPLDEYGLTVFSISHFECEARWCAGNSPGDAHIEVRVYFDNPDTSVPDGVYRFPLTSTLREIKRWTADYLLGVIEDMKQTVRHYHASHKEPCETTT